MMSAAALLARWQVALQAWHWQGEPPRPSPGSMSGIVASWAVAFSLIHQACAELNLT